MVGIEERKLVADLSETCVLPTEGAAKVRLFHGAVTEERFDLCIRNEAADDYAATGLFARSGGTCPAGVGYSEYTVGFGLEPGVYDFKLVPWGSGCDGEGETAAGVTLAEGESTTLALHGGSAEELRVTVLPDAVASGSGMDVQIRFVHLLEGYASLDAGLAESGELESGYATLIFRDTPFGEVAPQSRGSALTIDDVNERGYMRFGGGEKPPASIQLSAGVSGETTSILNVPVKLQTGRAYSLFAIGQRDDKTYLPKLWMCEEDTAHQYLARCGQPVEVSFEVFNTNLTDTFTPYIEERTLPAVEAILGSDADVLCLTELYPPEIQQLLAEGSSARFASRAFADDIPAERVSGELSDQAGELPSYPAVACEGAVADLLADFLTCGITSTTASGSAGELCAVEIEGEHFMQESGLVAEACMTNSCVVPALRLLAPPEGEEFDYYWCYTCGLAHLVSGESFEASLRACTTASEQPMHMAYGGRSGLAVLSRYPLGEPELIRLPSDHWQRSVMRVPVTLPNSAEVDFWCGSIRFPNSEDQLPYAGPYGEGAFGFEGNVAAQRLELMRLKQPVEEQAEQTGRTGIVAVSANCGPEVTNDDETLVGGWVTENYEALAEDWVPVVAPDWEPRCTYCGDAEQNALNEDASEVMIWSSHLLSPNLAPRYVAETERTFLDTPVNVRLADGSRADAPVSQHFGLRSRVEVTQ